MEVPDVLYSKDGKQKWVAGKTYTARGQLSKYVRETKKKLRDGLDLLAKHSEAFSNLDSVGTPFEKSIIDMTAQWCDLENEFRDSGFFKGCIYDKGKAKGSCPSISVSIVRCLGCEPSE